MIKTKISALILTAFLLSGCLSYLSFALSAIGAGCSLSNACSEAEKEAEEVEKELATDE